MPLGLHPQGARKAGREQPWCRHNPPEDQEDPVSRVEVSLWQKKGLILQKRVLRPLSPSVAKRATNPGLCPMPVVRWVVALPYGARDG